MKYIATRWWKVLGPKGELWCETSNEKEARDSMREGDTLYRLFEKTERRFLGFVRIDTQQWRAVK